MPTRLQSGTLHKILALFLRIFLTNRVNSAKLPKECVIEVSGVMSLRHVLVGVITLVAAGAVRGDLMPVIVDPPAVLPFHTRNVEPLVNECAFSCSGFANLDLLPVGTLVETRTGIEQAAEPPSLLVLSNEDSSIGLCFYGLLSLGLCKAAASVKMLSLCVVSACCYDGGLFDSDHSLALSRDCLAPAPAYCYVPTDGRAKNTLPRYCQKAILALLRQSQCTPTAQSLRGPPGLAS